jgi:hypothetical protein
MAFSATFAMARDIRWWTFRNTVGNRLVVAASLEYTEAIKAGIVSIIKVATD